MALDFTKKKYTELIEAISEAGYTTLPIRDYLQLKDKPEKFIILRHDVDMDSAQQIDYARIENEHDITSSYYYRHIPGILNYDMIDEVNSLGHEIGYHYETFTKARGNPARSQQIFKEEFAYFQDNWNSTTICPHGGSYVEGVNGYSLPQLVKIVAMLISKKEVFSSWDSRDIWNSCDMIDFGVAGDAHLSVDFDSILYLSDTGRSWDMRFKAKDRVKSSVSIDVPIKRTDDIIELIRQEKYPRIYLLVHFEQWKEKFGQWLGWYMAQIMRRSGKNVLGKMRK